jgi:membrane protein CcdC involved in cytochrome C biogenesis
LPSMFDSFVALLILLLCIAFVGLVILAWVQMGLIDQAVAQGVMGFMFFIIAFAVVVSFIWALISRR